MAKKVVRMGDLATVLEQRIQARLANLAPQDPRMREVLTRIGILIETEAKLNIRRKHIIDTGTLFNSIRYQLRTNANRGEVVVGSFGVPYAAAHEFGFEGPVTVRSHTRTVLFGRVVPPYSVPSYTRWHSVRKRPYLRPALGKLKGRIIELVREYYRGGP